jgi:hypothetical protein
MDTSFIIANDVAITTDTTEKPSTDNQEEVVEVESEQELQNFLIPNTEIDNFFADSKELEDLKFESREQERIISNNLNDDELFVDLVFQENDWKKDLGLNIDNNHQIFRSFETDINNPILEDKNDVTPEKKEGIPKKDNSRKEDKIDENRDEELIEERQEDIQNRAPKENPKKGARAFFRKIYSFFS